MPANQTIREDQVRHVAHLARLKLSDDEVHHFTDQLAAILQYVSKLNELDVDGVEPMAHALDMHSVLRDDAPQSGYPTERMLANAPEQDPPFFKVTKVLGDSPGA